MIVNEKSREECLIEKNILKLNALTDCKNVIEKRKVYKSLLRTFSNNPDIFRYLKKYIFDSYENLFNDIDNSSLYPSTMLTLIIVPILYGKDVDIDIKGVTELEIRNFLGFVMIMHMRYSSMPTCMYDSNILNTRYLDASKGRKAEIIKS